MKGKILVELQEFMGSDASIANSAWTSTYDHDRREEKVTDDDKISDLVRRCAKDGHSVPFESVIMRFWIRAPIFNDRQHMTHRVASHNGLSGRYRTMPDDWFPMPEDVKRVLSKINHGYGDYASRKFDELMEAQMDFYKTLLGEAKKAERAVVISNAEYKRVREIARGVIGTANMTERTSILNLRSFANYQRLRNSDHVQAEIRTVAQRMLELVKEAKIAPVAIAALEENGWRI